MFSNNMSATCGSLLIKSSKTLGSLKSVLMPGIKLNEGSSKSAQPILQMPKSLVSTV